MNLQSSTDFEQHPLVRLKNQLTESNCSKDMLLSLQRTIDASTQAEPVEGKSLVYYLFVINVRYNLINIAVLRDLSDRPLNFKRF